MNNCFFLVGFFSFFVCVSRPRGRRTHSLFFLECSAEGEEMRFEEVPSAVRRVVPFKVFVDDREGSRVYVINCFMSASGINFTFYNQKLDSKTTDISLVRRWFGGKGDFHYSSSSTRVVDLDPSSEVPSVACGDKKELLFDIASRSKFTDASSPVKEKTDLQSLLSATSSELQFVKDIPDTAPKRMRVAPEPLPPLPPFSFASPPHGREAPSFSSPKEEAYYHIRKAKEAARRVSSKEGEETEDDLSLACESGIFSLLQSSTCAGRVWERKSVHSFLPPSLSSCIASKMSGGSSSSLDVVPSVKRGNNFRKGGKSVPPVLTFSSGDSTPSVDFSLASIAGEEVQVLVSPADQPPSSKNSVHVATLTSKGGKRGVSIAGIRIR